MFAEYCYNSLQTMNTFKDFLEEYGREILIITAGFLLIFMLLWFRLGSLTYGNAAPIEAAAREAAVSWRTILENPLYAPYKAVQRVVMMTGHNGITSMRLVSTLWAIGAMILFYMVARQWHSMKVAALATWLFITSSWFLHTARLATPEVMWLVSILALVVLFSPRREGSGNRLAFPILVAALSAILYVPAMAWLVLLGIIIRRKNIAEAWHASHGFFTRAVSVLLGLGILAPLVWSFSKTPGLIRTWLGFSASFDTPITILKNFLSVPKQLFFSGPLDPVHWLGRVPLLSVFETFMFIIGAYFYLTHLKAARSKFIIILSLLAWGIIALGGLASLSLLVPVVYLVLTTGIAYMLHEWLKVFPNNPLARSIGVIVIAVAILLTSIYQTRSYFVAWRYSPDTARVFTQKL